MKKLPLVFAPIVWCALVACSKSPAPADSTRTAGPPNPGDLLSSPKIAPSSRPLGGEVERSTPSALDPTVPLDRYTDLNALPGGLSLSYMVTAKAATPLSYDERLDRLSAPYHAERDVFKRQEIAKTELPRVDSVLDEYRKQSYYSLPITSYGSQALSLTNLTLGAYQPASHSFPLVGYGGRCWGGSIRNPQGAVLHLDGSGPACSLVVSDEAVARAIESARASRTLQLAGTAYVFIPLAEKGTANGSVAAAKIVLTDGAGRTALGSFDLRGS